MKKNDKLIVITGVIVLILAAIGIYYWVPEEAGVATANVNKFITVTGDLKESPGAVTVSDSSPFYPLIATPLAVNYCEMGEQSVIPLYVMNIENPSRAILRVKEQLDGGKHCEIIGVNETPKEASIRIAREYWDKSNAALIIEHTEPGFNLGLCATPLASYLRIPVIVTDEIDMDVTDVLADLEVKKTIVCGENIKGYGDVLKFNHVDEIINASIEIIEGKLEERIDYITIANPVDAWPPEVIDSVEYDIGPVTIQTGATTEIVKALTGGMGTIIGDFTIPKNYTYALVKFTGINLNTENVELLGDSASFMIGIDDEDEPSGLQSFEIYAGSTHGGGVPIRDANGKIIEDRTYNEVVLYDRGGATYSINAGGTWLIDNFGDVKANIVIEKLSDPVYSLMKDISTIAPYLTAYHKGIIFAKPEFAFTADDDVLHNGWPSPGYFVPRRNADIVGASNDHVFEIHDQINELLAKLADIELEREFDLKELRDYYKDSPVYITLCGGTVGIPQFTYDNGIEPVDEEHAGYFGLGLPSDFIYGNIDPIRDWHGNVMDLYSEIREGERYPYQENIVGRITGWDVQDANALILRSLFYDEIIEDLGEWKDTAIIQMGGGNDFQKPPLKYRIFGNILGLTRRGEPLKMWTGSSILTGLTLQKNVQGLGFETEIYRENEAILKGFSNEAINKLKKANLLNRLLLSKRQLKNAIGEDVCKGKEQQEGANFIMANAHGNQHNMIMGDVGIYKLGLGLPRGIISTFLQRFLAPIMGLGPGISYNDLGSLDTRNVEYLDLGPSVLWMESCIVGEIDGVYPQQGLSQAYVHAGCGTVIAATTCSNIAGGYVEPKRRHYDIPGTTLLRFIKAKRDLEKRGIYPEQHFGFKFYSDMLEALKKEEGTSIGYAFREARNNYLDENEINWKVWWSPPLVLTGNPEIDRDIYNKMAEVEEGYLPRMDNKFLSFYEYTIYGDPALTPYIPMHG
ncbi:hypothetical protein AYK21_05115 [Thermoplasmatales archaeon SG8-52-2]|nr:MAG: hypothetical protein AYK21_05115 [Thermoplasmatales archaeon SG8-52-2]